MTRLILTLSTLIALSACNTIAGAGQDLSATGDAITSETRDVQADL